ncbi:MAG: hypothetical protein IT374_10460 [Polyangiaceae bacterium]|nr:hypothetical protein [Polyangiaceae bacterium]
MSGRGAPPDWLSRRSPRGWIDASLAELSRARSAFASGDARAGTVATKRAAGMALNAVLILFPDERWGRTYVEHVVAAAADAALPAEVRLAAGVVAGATPPGGPLVALRSRASDERTLEAARTVMAFALRVVMESEEGDEGDEGAPSGSAGP